MSVTTGASSDARDTLTAALTAQARVLEALAALAAESPTGDPPEYVDAAAMGLDVNTFRKAAKAGEFDVFLVGRKWVARRADVRAYIERQRIVPGQSGSNPIDQLLGSGRLKVVRGLREK